MEEVLHELRRLLDDVSYGNVTRNDLENRLSITIMQGEEVVEEEGCTCNCGCC